MGTFGEWLREQREARKLNREEFARLVGCSVAMLRKIDTRHLITHRISVSDAATAYRIIDRQPPDTIQVLLT